MPLILTAQLDPESDLYFNTLRSRHFPPERNIVPAHITLFHHLPDSEASAVTGELQCAATSQTPFSIRVTGLRNLGRGVAFTLESLELATLRSRLASQWWDWLTPQDRQPYQPHITIQNKATPATARATLALLQTTWQRPTVEALGLKLWNYRNGPWELLKTYPFISGSRRE